MHDQARGTRHSVAARGKSYLCAPLAGKIQFHGAALHPMLEEQMSSSGQDPPYVPGAHEDVHQYLHKFSLEEAIKSVNNIMNEERCVLDI